MLKALLAFRASRAFFLVPGFAFLLSGSGFLSAQDAPAGTLLQVRMETDVKLWEPGDGTLRIGVQTGLARDEQIESVDIPRFRAALEEAVELIDSTTSRRAVSEKALGEFRRQDHGQRPGIELTFSATLINGVHRAEVRLEASPDVGRPATAVLWLERPHLQVLLAALKSLNGGPPDGWSTPSPPYPFQAKKARLMGSTVVRIQTDRDGRITQASLDPPLNPVLDVPVLKFVRETWRGPAFATGEIPISFVLKD